MENKSETKILFTEKEFDDVTKYLIGNNVRLYPNLIVPQTCGKMQTIYKSLLQSLSSRSCQDTVHRGEDDAEYHGELSLQSRDEWSGGGSTGRIHGTLQQQHSTSPHSSDDHQRNIDRHEELHCQQCPRVRIYWINICR